MKETPPDVDYKDRKTILRIIGVVILAIGCLAAFLGPLEMFCFYLFSEGGAFHYEGFRFGSFMFGNLAAQITGYYFIAALLIPLGYGTIRLRSWARHLMYAMIRFWVVAGLPLIAAFFFVLVSSKDLPLPVIVLTAVVLAAAYLFLPGVLRRFYGARDTRLSFGAPNPDGSWIETIPIPLLALGCVFVFFILILHAQIFFNGIFPVFGTWISGLAGIVLLDASIIALAVLLWGTVRVRRWAWWGGLVYFGIVTCSYIITLSASSWQELLATLDFPSYEMEILQGIPLHGYHLAILAALPFSLTIVSIVRARPCFSVRRKPNGGHR